MARAAQGVLSWLGARAMANPPPRALLTVDEDFVSPSELAWAAMPHVDFNVQPGRPLDPPTR